jgi:hypothetical protein
MLLGGPRRGGQVAPRGEPAAAGGVVPARQRAGQRIGGSVRIGRGFPVVRRTGGGVGRLRQRGLRRSRGRVGNGCRGVPAPLRSRGDPREREGRIPAPVSSLFRATISARSIALRPSYCGGHEVAIDELPTQD